MSIRSYLKRRLLYLKKLGFLNGSKTILDTIRYKKSKKVITVSVLGIAKPILLRAGTSDIPTFEKIFLDGEYDFRVEFEPLIIIDGGANIGLASIFFANRFPAAKIAAVEPESSNFELLQANSKPYPNIVAVKAALWNKEAYLRITNLKEDQKWLFQIEEASQVDEGVFRSVTIDGVLEKVGGASIDILKLDIEGSERELFSSNVDSWLRKVRVLVIELHDRLRPGCSEAVKSAVSKYPFAASAFGEHVLFRREG